MIFIVVKFDVLEEHRDTWLERTKEFTDATRSEPGNLWFDWFHSAEIPDSTSWWRHSGIPRPGPITSTVITFAVGSNPCARR